jgi:catechol 2,3-dioxygenase-like lactoylglutathione lyase family enzyme
VQIVKDGLDIGLLTADPAMVGFFRDVVGLGDPERLTITEQVTQHRFAVGPSVVKVNVAPAVGTARSGYRGILLARDVGSAVDLVGPDDIAVRLVPARDLRGAALAIRLAVPDVDITRSWFVDTLGWEMVAPDCIQVGSTALLLEVDTSVDATPPTSELVGWTYLTVQIRDCIAETDALEAAGAHIAAPVRDLGDVARFSMVADPFGNQLEISQRSSITGPLGPAPLDAGPFWSWLDKMEGALRGERDADVPCGGCTACCTASQFVHIAPDETDTLAHIPDELLFPAPRMPKGHVLLGYDERGHCPMLVDGGCSIYDHRPRTCRTYDCRVFPAAAVAVDEDDPTKIGIAIRAARWHFRHPTAADRHAHDAVRAAAVSLRARDGTPAMSNTQLAVRAVDIARGSGRVVGPSR